MANMYPNNQTLQIFGEEVVWPGVDQNTGKFTNGSFSDPMIKPSFIPAETVNLILDNMADLISDMGLVPNNTDPEQIKKALRQGLAPRVVGEYHYLAYRPSITELVRMRYLPLEYQIIQIALYPELCGIKWVGSSANASADWWYKCDSNGTRNTNGLYMRVEDARGMFYRGAGANAIKKGANDTPYDGKGIGSYGQDTICLKSGYFHIFSMENGADAIFTYTGPFTVSKTPEQYEMAFSFKLGDTKFQRIDFIVPRPGDVTAPASISALVCISY